MPTPIGTQDQSVSLMDQAAGVIASAALTGALAHKAGGLIRGFIGPGKTASFFASRRLFATTAALGTLATSWHAFFAARNWIQDRDVQNSRNLLLGAGFNWLATGSAVVARFTRHRGLAASLPLIQGLAAVVGLAIDSASLKNLYQQHQQDPQAVTTGQLVMQAGLTCIFGFDQGSRGAMAGLAKQAGSAIHFVFQPQVRQFRPASPGGPPALASTVFMTADDDAGGVSETERIARGLIKIVRKEGATGQAILDEPIWMGALILHSAGLPDGNSFRLGEYHMTLLRDTGDFYSFERISPDLEAACKRISGEFLQTEGSQFKMASWDGILEKVAEIEGLSASESWRLGHSQAKRMLRAAHSFHCLDQYQEGTRGAGRLFGVELEFNPPRGDEDWAEELIPRLKSLLDEDAAEFRSATIHEARQFDVDPQSPLRPWWSETLAINRDGRTIEVEIHYRQGTGEPITRVIVDNRLLKFDTPVVVDLSKPTGHLLHVMQQNIEAVYARLATLSWEGSPIGVESVAKARETSRVLQGWMFKDNGKRMVKVLAVKKPGGHWDIQGHNCLFGSQGLQLEQRGGQYPSSLEAIYALRREASSGTLRILPRTHHEGLSTRTHHDNRMITIVEETTPSTLEVMFSPLPFEEKGLDYLRRVSKSLSRLGAEGEDGRFNDSVSLQVHVDVPVLDQTGQVTPAGIVRLIEACYRNTTLFQDALPAAPHRRVYFREPDEAFKLAVLKGDLNRLPAESMHDWILRVAQKINSNSPPHFAAVNFDNVIDYMLDTAVTQSVIVREEATALMRSGRHMLIPTVEFRRLNTPSRREQGRPALDPDGVVYDVSRIVSFAHAAINNLL